MPNYITFCGTCEKIVDTSIVCLSQMFISSGFIVTKHLFLCFRIYPEKTPSPLNNALMPTPPPPPPKDKIRSPDSSCGHRNAGQELCYLCHQRDRRNIPVSFTEERKKRELEEDRLLQQYQQLKDVEAIFKEQVPYSICFYTIKRSQENSCDETDNSSV